MQPHAHYRAREIKGIATLPDGSTRWMMHITDWDFRWQHVYREVAPIALPRGTVLSMEYTFDNSAENVRNPQLPPVRVSWGQRTQDEMGDLWFQLLARSDRDRATLARDVNRKMTAEDVNGYETMLRVSPDDAELHDDVALLYLGLGRPADAVRHFAASAAIQPQSAAAQYNLGTALIRSGAREEGRPGPFGQKPAARQPDQKGPEDRILHVAAFRDPMKEMDKLHELYESVAEARREVGEEPVPFHKFADLVKSQVKKLKAPGTEVAFRVAVKDGKVNFTAKALKGK